MSLQIRTSSLLHGGHQQTEVCACLQGFLAEGLQRTSAGLGSVIIDSQPLTVALLASVLFGERLGALGFLGLGLGVVGLCLLEVPVEALQGELSLDRLAADAKCDFLACPFTPALPHVGCQNNYSWHFEYTACRHGGPVYVVYLLHLLTLHRPVSSCLHAMYAACLPWLQDIL